MSLPSIERLGFHCTQCGHCCHLPDAFVLCAESKDLKRWEEERREDILAWTDEISPGVVDLWINPITGEEATKRCPWFRKCRGQEKYRCLIHETKPTHCHGFPKSREHAWREGCPGWGSPPPGWDPKKKGGIK